MKLGLTVLTCGKCGKPRGRRHLCRGTRRGRDRLQFRFRFTCGTCGRQMANPFTHTCTVQSDWAKRRRAQERAERARQRREHRKQMRAEAAKRRRAAAKARRDKTAAERKNRRPRASPHNPSTCTDEECTRYGCLKYRQGFADGVASVSGEGDG